MTGWWRKKILVYCVLWVNSSLQSFLVHGILPLGVFIANTLLFFSELIKTIMSKFML